jgi:hypothetical protein
MSEDSYRNHMMRTFEENGLLDQLKVQLRTSLLEKLRDRDKAKAVGREAGLARKIAASLIQEYLFQNQHHYTLSVFAPEAGGPLFERGELAALLRLERDAGQSLLETLLRSRLPGEEGCCTHAMVQTEASDNFLLDQKLRALDDQHYRQLQSCEGTTQERLARFENETRRRLKDEMAREVDRVRTIEVAAVRAQESEKARLRVAELKQELEEQYFARLDQLKAREQEALALYRHKSEQLESKSHSFRQRMESELEYLRIKEEEVKAREGRNEDWLAGEKAKLERQERLLREQLKKEGIIM